MDLGLGEHFLDLLVLGLLVLFRLGLAIHEARLVQKLAQLFLCCAALVCIVILEAQLAHIRFVKVLVILLKIDLFIGQFDSIVA